VLGLTCIQGTIPEFPPSCKIVVSGLAVVLCISSTFTSIVLKSQDVVRVVLSGGVGSTSQ
jgi:hypothetical protein